MPSSFTWIDHSEAHRRKMLDAIDLFREQGTRDELGLSVIRDGFADLLFPGTGALQTRARYFFFVPWMYQYLERERVRSSDIARDARAFEVRLIKAVLQSEDHAGTIGARARDELHRLPSSIYWNGLRRLQVRLFQGSQDDYHRSLDAYYRSTSRRQKTDDGEPLEPDQPNWHPRVPPAPAAFEALGGSRAEPSPVSLTLKLAEAEYLADRIRGTVGTSLFAWFLDQLEATSDAPFAWAHDLAPRLPDRLKRQVVHAQTFSDVMAGASVLYNGLVCEGPPRRGENCDEMEAKFADWFKEIGMRAAALDTWDRLDFWALVAESGARPTPGARAFVDRWVELALGSSSARALWGSEDARTLIRNREWNLKKSLARLHSQHARETWNGYTGLGRMDFRWRDAEVVLNDILTAQGRA
jgi:hypothetical protein